MEVRNRFKDLDLINRVPDMELWNEVRDTVQETGIKTIPIEKKGGGVGIPVELFQILKDDAVKMLHSICQQIRKTHQWPQDWKRSVFIPISKKGNAKEC